MGEEELDESFSIDEDVSAGSVVLRLKGELDMACAGTLRRRVTDLLAARHEVGVLVFDLAALEFVDSSGLQAIVESRRRAMESGHRVEVRDPQPLVRRVLEVTGLDRVLLDG